MIGGGISGVPLGDGIVSLGNYTEVSVTFTDLEVVYFDGTVESRSDEITRTLGHAFTVSACGPTNVTFDMTSGVRYTGDLDQTGLAISVDGGQNNACSP